MTHMKLFDESWLKFLYFGSLSEVQTYVHNKQIDTIVIHSFIPDISVAPLQVHYYSEAPRLLHRYCVRVNTPKRYRQLSVKDLPKVPSWRLERCSNL